MRIRTLVAVGVGAALGAGGMYLLDPEHGDARRREAASRAAERGREELTGATRDLRRRATGQARHLATQVRVGFVAGVSDADRAG